MMIPKKIKTDLKVIGTQIKTTIATIRHNFPKGTGFIINAMTGQLNNALKKIEILNMYIDMKNEEEKNDI